MTSINYDNNDKNIRNKNIDFENTNYTNIISQNLYIWIILKILQVIPSLICNAIIINYFVISLNILGAGTATALNSGLSFVFTTFNEAIFIDKDILSYKKLIGIFLVVIGTILIVDNKDSKEKDDNKVKADSNCHNNYSNDIKKEN